VRSYLEVYLGGAEVAAHVVSVLRAGVVDLDAAQ
jgi:hypothetical protein